MEVKLCGVVCVCCGVVRVCRSAVGATECAACGGAAAAERGQAPRIQPGPGLTHCNIPPSSKHPSRRCLCVCVQITGKNDFVRNAVALVSGRVAQQC